MSMRVHVAAAYGVEPQELNEVLPGAQTQQSGPWSWLSASVWSVNGEDIDKGLVRLIAPSFRVTTVDGCMWYLNLFHGGEQQFTWVHFFDWVRGNDVEEDRRKSFLSLLKDYDVYGVTVSKQLRNDLKGLPFDEARQRYVFVQAEDLCNAFDKAGIPYDRKELMSVLIGTTVTDEELAWDVGNLPRFLEALGMGDVFPGWREEAESPDRSHDEEEAGEEPDYAGELIARWAGGDSAALDGAPVEHPLRGLHQVCRIAWFCDEDIDAAFRITPPPGAHPRLNLSSLEYVRTCEAEGCFHVGYPTGGAKWATLHWTREVGPLLEDLPDGTTLELFTHSEYPIGCHRYSGHVLGGTWRIAEVSPPAPREAFSQALALSELVDEPAAFKARSPEDAEQIAARAIEAYSLGESGLKKPQVQGQSLVLRGKNVQMERNFVALCAFRRWFQDTWDTRQVDADIDENRAEWDEMIQSVGDSIAHALADAFPTGDLVHEGEAATFHTVARDPGDLPDSFVEADEAFAALGMSYLGEMTCSAAPGVALRGYASPDGAIVGVHMIALLGEYFDFVTYYADGSSLTTTTTENARNDPARHIYKKHYRGSDLGRMYKQHQEHSAKLQDKHGPPQTLPTTLKGLAETMDEFLVRSGFAG